MTLPIRTRRTAQATATALLPGLLSLVLASPLTGLGGVALVDESGQLAPTTVTTVTAVTTSEAPATELATSGTAAAASTAQTAPDAATSPLATPLDTGDVPFVGPIVTTPPTAPVGDAPAAATRIVDDVTDTAAGIRRMMWKMSGPSAPRPSASAPASALGKAVSPNGVLNPDGAAGTHGWQADSAAGPVTLRVVTGVTGAGEHRTALQLDRTGGSGDWARAVAALRSPAAFFTPGRSYTMAAWVRDLRASGQSLGVLVADGAYQNRPTEMSAYRGFGDDRWHLISRTFTATAKAGSDTGLYLSLPENGPVSVQVTGLVVREVTGETAAATKPASRTLDFNGAAGTVPDPAVWNHETGGNGWGNGELQTYTDRASNASLDGNGNLVVTARREDHVGRDGILRHYTSARLSTEGKLVVQPGSYVEASITAPVGKSVWPAFWLIGANIREVGWPASGELDVFEGSGGSPTKAFNAAHMAKAGDPTTDMQYGWGDGGTVDLGRSLDTGAHLYGVFFDGSTVRFFLDRREVRTLTAQEAVASGRTWPFGKPQYMVLNVAVAGDDGDPVGTTFPRAMSVGEISVWNDGVPFAS